MGGCSSNSAGSRKCRCYKVGGCSFYNTSGCSSFSDSIIPCRQEMVVVIRT